MHIVEISSDAFSSELAAGASKPEVTQCTRVLRAQEPVPPETILRKWQISSQPADHAPVQAVEFSENGIAVVALSGGMITVNYKSMLDGRLILIDRPQPATGQMAMYVDTDHQDLIVMGLQGPVVYRAAK